MSTSPTPSTSPSESTLGASLQCPVCYEMFGTRIFQCRQGHSVCDKCYGKISSQQCPQCRSNYMGTRNYILEEVIKQLKSLKIASVKHTEKSKAPSKNADEKLTHEITKLVKLILSVEEVPAIPIPTPTPAAFDLGLSVNEDNTLAQSLSISNPRRINLSAVSQPGGQFNCRMLSCTETLPICRMMNHIRTFHAAHLVDYTNNLDDFVTHFSFPYASYRRALHISRFGLFFFIVNVQNQGKYNVITAWVQIVGRRSECRRFSYELNLRLGNLIGTFKDVTYGDWTNIKHIEESAECLVIKTNQTNTTRYKEINVALSINKLSTMDTTPRSKVTNIQNIHAIR